MRLYTVVLAVSFLLASCNYYESFEPLRGERGGPDTWQTLKVSFFEPYCLRCHSGAEPRGGVSFETYHGCMEAELIVTGNPNDSRLYVSVRDGEMTERGPRPPAELVERLKNWIAAGAIETAP